MKIYLVGGAVRDALLGLPVKERDWVVVGATQAEMLTQGYKQVGKDFPVFLHPKTKEEYALARTERKTGHGYDGFEVHAAVDVTLEEDLLRRDLTINAIAKDDRGELVDRFGGVADIKRKVLRHVSDAFIEDPLRLVRLCRFQARFAGFTIHERTEQLCKSMVSSGEVNHLTPERVWLEWQKVFSVERPELFLQTLDRFGAWMVLMPAMNQVEQDIRRVQEAALTIRDERLFTVLGWYLDQDVLKQQLRQLRLPKDVFQLCVLVHSLQEVYQKTRFDISAEILLRRLYQWDVFRRKSRFDRACTVIHAVIGKGCPLNKISQMVDVIAKIRPDISPSKVMTGEQVAEDLFKQREKRLAELMQGMPRES